MSPLSVARYLAVDGEPFDVVVFDEASQLRASEALGAMGRAKQVVMVGDPKQLPPTSFFDRSTDEDEADGDGAPEGYLPLKLDSILDLCRTAKLPEHVLRWHYRSRHEDLIAFSNAAYYGGELVTFCPPSRNARAITYHRVPNAYWTSGTARHNPVEARALVADLVARVRSGELARDGREVGIIAFNGAQARTIDALLQAAALNDPSLAAAIGTGGSLNLFVKSLENVQGDERDIIYLSVAYGPSGPGAPIAARFGPLNQEGGERRLNVAITRARAHLHVFCSFASAQLEDAKLKARGARDLKAFLAYAEHGPADADSATGQRPGPLGSRLEQSVAEALRALGWQVDLQVGAGTFRLALGVVDPARPGHYLAGITSDGAAYRDAPTVRDRERTRQAVLTTLGWRTLRLWSTAYWQDPEGTVARLHRALEALARASMEAAAAAQATPRRGATYEARPSGGPTGMLRPAPPAPRAGADGAPLGGV